MIDVLGEIPDFIPAEGGIHVPGQFFTQQFNGGRQFDPRAVAVRHIHHNGLAYIVDLPGQHQLIAVIHEIKVGSGREYIPFTGVAKLIIDEPLRSWNPRRISILVVVPAGLTVGDPQREIEVVVFVKGQVQTSLWVEEIELVRLINGSQVIQRSLHLIGYATVLQIGKEG